MRSPLLQQSCNKYLPFSFSPLRQFLLHRPGFQHLITAAPAAPVVTFCCSNYYLSSWHCCPNLNSNRKVLEKKKELCSEIALQCYIRIACLGRIDNPTHGSAAKRAYHYTTRALHLVRQSAVFKLNQ